MEKSTLSIELEPIHNELMCCGTLNYPNRWHYVYSPMVQFMCGHYACFNCIEIGDLVMCGECRSSEPLVTLKNMKKERAEYLIAKNAVKIAPEIQDLMKTAGDVLVKNIPQAKRKVESKYLGMDCVFDAIENNTIDQSREHFLEPIRQQIAAFLDERKHAMKKEIWDKIDEIKERGEKEFNEANQLINAREMNVNRLYEYNEKLKKLQKSLKLFESFDKSLFLDPNLGDLELKKHRLDPFYFQYRSINDRLNKASVNTLRFPNYKPIRLVQLENGSFVCTTECNLMVIMNRIFQVQREIVLSEADDKQILLHDPKSFMYVLSPQNGYMKQFDDDGFETVTTPYEPFTDIYAATQMEILVTINRSIRVYDRYEFLKEPFSHSPKYRIRPLMNGPDFSYTQVVATSRSVCATVVYPDLGTTSIRFFNRHEGELMSEAFHICGKLFVFNDYVYMYSADQIISMFDYDGFLLQRFRTNLHGLTPDHELMCATNKYLIFYRSPDFLICRLHNTIV